MELSTWYGKTVTAGKFKDSSFKLKLSSNDKVSKYTIHFVNSSFSAPENLVKFFNVTKTTDNTLNFMKNVDGLYDFYTESDKTFDGSIKALQNITGIGENSKAFSIFDKYGTKIGKTIVDVVGLIGG